MPAATLLREFGCSVVNVGLKGFADNVIAAGGECVALDWQPPAQGDRDAGWGAGGNAQSPGGRSGQCGRAWRVSSRPNPVLSQGGYGARMCCPGMADGRRLILHAGPPVDWAQMCGPMQGAVIGAVLLRGLGRFARGAEAGRQR